MISSKRPWCRICKVEQYNIESSAQMNCERAEDLLIEQRGRRRWHKLRAILVCLLRSRLVGGFAVGERKSGPSCSSDSGCSVA